MKLRIRGNSVRLRLGQGEVRRLATEGAVEEVTQFDLHGNHRLIYRLEAAGNAAGIEASFESGILLVRIPAEEARRWATSEEVGIEKLQTIGVAGPLKILIEKDFECIDARPDEPQDDAYPHPGNNADCAPSDTPRPRGVSKS